MEPITALFKCNETSQTQHGHAVKLFAVTNGTPEATRLFRGHPSGAMHMMVMSEQGAANFAPGQEFVVTFTPVS